GGRSDQRSVDRMARTGRAAGAPAELAPPGLLAGRRDQALLLKDLGRHDVAVGRVAVLLVVGLVVSLGWIERRERPDLGGDGTGEPGLGPVAGSLGRRELLGRVREDRAPVLVADVRPLPIHL